MKTPKEQPLHTRREFLRTSVLGGALASTVPLFLEKTFLCLDTMAAATTGQITTGKDGTILVLLQLAGGNDGLNTLVPFGDDAYYKARPRIALPKKDILSISDYAGLHPKLTGLHTLYGEGNLGMIQGVGYPNPNRSHFRSTEIWQTASDSEKNESEGWLGRYFDNCCKGADPSTVGIAVAGQTPQAFASPIPKGIAFSNPQQYRYMSEAASDPASADKFMREMNQPAAEHSSLTENAGGSIGMLSGPADNDGSTVEFLQRTALGAQMSSDKILEITRKTKSSVNYPTSQLGNSLNLVSRLIAGGLPTRVYYVSQGGFDTHANQLPAHERLMTDMNAAISAFVADLKAQGNFNRVLMLSFSEFGRRVSENASGGTDHGAAAPLFVLGGGVKPGLYGNYPSLTDLHDGDLKFNTDFRSVYATALENWLGAPSEMVLGKKYPLLPFI
ncbi:MAG: DUF1501 domain-containing protein [Chthoniobacterales bacterium]|jgi:uncharacterized protein (DUF1501 family)